MWRRYMLVIVIVGLCCTLSAAPILAQGGEEDTPAVQDGQATIHVVQRGETLFRIAMNYGTSVEAIAQTNGLLDATSIQTGQRLLIPSGATAALATSAQHIVQPGETLQHIAVRYGTTPDILAAINNVVNPHGLYVGEMLNVGETEPGHPAVAAGYTHIVTAGETLYQIAARYGATLGDIQRANGLDLPSLIYPGQTLIVPGPAEGPAPALQALPAPLTSLTIYPLPAEVGRTIRVRLQTNAAVSATAAFIDRQMQFGTGADAATLDAYYGVQAFTEPGLYPLTITLQDSAGGTTTLTVQVRVADGHYNSEQINLPQEQAVLLDPILNADEYDLLQTMMTGYSPDRYFDGPLGLPTAAPVTSPFGTRRSYNGSAYDRFHAGADFGAAPGASIIAPAGGTVVYVGRLDIHGLTTIIDHGQGVFTAYVHQSEAYVTVGQFITTGDTLGAVGNTGRSLGPHLHWEMWVNGVEVDPLQWARLDFS